MSLNLLQGTYNYHTNWLLIDIDNEWGRLYRALFKAFRHNTEYLQPPQYGMHVSVVSSYDPKPIEYFQKKYHGKKVDILVDLENPEDGGTYLWFPVSCPDAQRVRTELGLGEPHWPFHLTLGNRKYERTY